MVRHSRLLYLGPICEKATVIVAKCVKSHTKTDRLFAARTSVSSLSLSLSFFLIVDHAVVVCLYEVTLAVLFRIFRLSAANFL